MYTSVDEPRAMHQTSKPEKRLPVLAGQFDGFHGSMVLTNASGEFSSNHDDGRGGHRRPHPEAVSESIVVACGMMAHRRCGVGP